MLGFRPGCQPQVKRGATMLRNSKGFTLIELLIVVVIIGILAAIAIPQFASTKEKAFDAAAKSDLRNMMTAQEAYFSDYQLYTNITATAGATYDLGGDGSIDGSASQQVTVQATANTDGYLITANHASSPTTWCVDTSASSGAARLGQIGVSGTDC
ncbi:MAG: prepilin-type N-terminal cleavage/methylation domain-containing protein [Gemmatimonadota bacterium]|nr:prepilin-type N-terminal cleavage/methylation domain-containing protein [Gemmatimonadota bacterium]